MTHYKNIRYNTKLIKFNHIKTDRSLKSIFGPAILNDQMWKHQRRWEHFYIFWK